MHQVYIGLGSNLDNPAQQLQRAVNTMRQSDLLQVCQVSSAYLTSPVGPAGQDAYVNAVVECATELSPQALLSLLQRIELDQGRERQQHWGSRTLDLDILLYNMQQINEPGLVIPHPHMHERAFVLYPLHELNKQLEIPGQGSIAALLDNHLVGEIQQRLDIVL